MSRLTINFVELPIWVTHEEAKNLIPSRKLKELREGGKLRHHTIEGKLSYLLIDVLSASGVNNLVVHGEAPIAEPPATEVAPTPTPAPTPAPQAETESYKRTFFFTDLFTFESNALPKDCELPTLRIRKGPNDFKYNQEISGLLIDVQYYNAQVGQDVFPKVRFILQSLTNPEHYLVLQTRYDKYHSGWFANVLAEAACQAKDFTQPFTLKLSKENGQNAYEVSIGSYGYKFVNPTEFQPPVEYKVLEAKLTGGLNNLKEQKVHRAVLTASSDKNYTKNATVTKPNEDAEF